MSRNQAARATALLLLALLAGACGKKGPLYLPDEAVLAPAPPAPAAMHAAERARR